MNDLTTKLNTLRALADAATLGKRIRNGVTLPGIGVMSQEGFFCEDGRPHHSDEMAAQTVRDFDLIAATDPEVIRALVEVAEAAMNARNFIYPGVSSHQSKRHVGEALDTLNRVLQEKQDG